MKKTVAIAICLALILGLTVPAYAAPPEGLTWDGKPATLAEISEKCGYQNYYGSDMVDEDGAYRPLWYDCAVQLWENGLFLGSGESFNLDNPISRAEGIVMTIRLLGKETEAKATTGGVTFTDVPDWAKPYVAYAVQNGVANGYSAERFGAGDPMTAAQFITFVLRAMGYKDGADFVWDKSYDKAVEIGLIGAPCHNQYSRSNLFLRDNAAVIAYNATFVAPTKSGGLLKDTITMPGQPSGGVPSATRTGSGTASASGEGDPSVFEIIKGPEGFEYFKWYALPGGNYTATVTYFLYVGDYGGTINYKFTMSPAAMANTVSDSFNVTAGAGEYVRLDFGFSLVADEYNRSVSNYITIEIGDYVFKDTISTFGTLHNVVIR